MSLRRTIVAWLAGLGVLAGSAEAQIPAASLTTRAEIVAILGRAWDLDSIGRSVWPGFSLREQVLILSAVPDGPTGIVGDSDPPGGFEPSADDPRVALLDGPVPDSLAMLQIGMSWNGRPNVATVYPITAVEPGDRSSERLIQSLIHESFHALQHRLGFDSFVSGRPEFSSLYVWLSAVEGTLLADALVLPSESDRRARAIEALAIRSHKCRAVSVAECAYERGIERLEGTATYVATAILERAGTGGHTDTLAEYLRKPPAHAILDRGWFYLTGEAWSRLIAGRSPDSSWTRRLPAAALHEVFAAIAGVDQEGLSAVAARVLDSDRAQQAAQAVDSVLAAERFAADSVKATYEAAIGTRLTITNASWCNMSTSRSGTWYEVDGASYTLDGASAVRFGQGSTWYRVAGMLLIMGGGSVTTVVSGNIVAKTDNGDETLDRAGVERRGQMEITAPAVEIHAQDAEVVTAPGEVRVVLHGGDPRACEALGSASPRGSQKESSTTSPRDSR